LTRRKLYRISLLSQKVFARLSWPIFDDISSIYVPNDVSNSAPKKDNCIFHDGTSRRLGASFSLFDGLDGMSMNQH
jgi:hypothetical protein